MADIQSVAARVGSVDAKLDLLIKLVADLKAAGGLTPEQQQLIDAADAELAAMEAKEDAALATP